MSRAVGIDEETMADLGRYRESERFTAVERLALDLAVAMTRTPVVVPAELRAALLEVLTPGQLAELASMIAWENHRARLNRALGVEAMGFSDGAYCVLPASEKPVDSVDGGAEDGARRRPEEGA